MLCSASNRMHAQVNCLVTEPIANMVSGSTGLCILQRTLAVTFGENCLAVFDNDVTESPIYLIIGAMNLGGKKLVDCREVEGFRSRRTALIGRGEWREAPTQLASSIRNVMRGRFMIRCHKRTQRSQEDSGNPSRRESSGFSFREHTRPRV